MSWLIKVAIWSGKKSANVVFVHGIGGHPYYTWQAGAGHETYWPLWLAEDVTGISVFSLYYSSPLTNWLGTAMPFTDEAENVLRILLNEPELATGPICFVCHSLGGLIVKQVLRSAKEQASDCRMADLLNRTRQVLFIATPHTGSGKATLLERFSFLFWGSRSAKILLANSPELRALNLAYRSLAEERRAGLRHLAFYEMTNTSLGQIVAPDSADPGLPNCRPVPIPADHRELAKPKRRDDLVYLEARRFVTELVETIDVAGTLEIISRESIKREYSWKHLVPMLIRVAILLAVIGAVSIGYLAAKRSHDELTEGLDKLARQVDQIAGQLLGSTVLARSPEVENAVVEAVQSTATGARDGDVRLSTALELLQHGRVQEAGAILRAVAEDKAERKNGDSNATAAAFRSFGAIAGLSDPRRAEEAYRRALDYEPNDTESLYWVGWLSLLAGRLGPAETMLNRLLELATSTYDEAYLFWANVRLGEVSLSRGNLSRAKAYQAAAHNIANRHHLGDDPADPDWRRKLSIVLEKIGDIFQTQGQLQDALSDYEAALVEVQELHKSDPLNLAWRRDVATSLNKVADIRRMQGDADTARKMYNESFEIRKQMADLEPSNASVKRDLSISYEKLGEIAQADGNALGALAYFRMCLALRRQLSEADSSNFTWQRDVSVARERMGDAYYFLRDYRGALEQYQVSLSIRQKLAAVDEANLKWQQDLGTALAKEGSALRALGELSGARDRLLRVLAIRDRLSSMDGQNALWRVDVALGCAALGQLDAQLENRTHALEMYNRAAELLRPLAETADSKVWRRYLRDIESEIASLSNR
jgi:tetratricopeptide (TPR) repeat protein